MICERQRWDVKGRSLGRLYASFAAVLMVATACSGGENAPASSAAVAITTLAPVSTDANAPTSVPAEPSVRPPVACSPADCAVSAVRFEAPLDLARVRALAGAASAGLVALWRTDPICVPDLGSPPGTKPSGGVVASQFAYADADLLREIQNQGPPATDGGWSLAMRDRFVTEWEQALEPGTRFEGAVLLTHSAPVAAPGIRDQAPVDWYLTDVTSVLYLRGHEAALADFFGTPTDC